MGKILPILLIVIGLAAGGAAGFFLRPPPPEPEEVAAGEDAEGDYPAEDDAEMAEEDSESATHEYVKLNNQFVVPLVDEARVTAMVVMSLSLEVEVGGTESVYAVEPKLRDSFLQVLFDHANTGGFRGVFTSTSNMDVLRRALKEAARKVLGRTVNDVLISDIVRQDIQ
ncbi:flagellar basal body-associated protein FliL [Thioclava sp. SK-1]|uniref:flagellar basal body-associated FliL family protein n=1 Tax=Thioclava sp. SK-1 TaxID=1889770 RepID=UPI000826FE69|nr:flagellar basal body-associated FliL family protein [Thioclava sp. SK-1]OCX65398.1 flagellar basal body-associated protein FliL [Thioclava sp. SK-1]